MHAVNKFLIVRPLEFLPTELFLLHSQLTKVPALWWDETKMLHFLALHICAALCVFTKDGWAAELNPQSLAQ